MQGEPSLCVVETGLPITLSTQPIFEIIILTYPTYTAIPHGKGTLCNRPAAPLQSQKVKYIGFSLSSERIDHLLEN